MHALTSAGTKEGHTQSHHLQPLPFSKFAEFKGLCLARVAWWPSIVLLLDLTG